MTGPDGYKYEPVWVNPTDAGVLGLETGDVVKLYNERGAVLGGVRVTERIMPGVVYQDHGSRVDSIVLGRAASTAAARTTSSRRTPRRRRMRSAR